MYACVHEMGSSDNEKNSLDLSRRKILLYFSLLKKKICYSDFSVLLYSLNNNVCVLGI